MLIKCNQDMMMVAQTVANMVVDDVSSFCVTKQGLRSNFSQTGASGYKATSLSRVILYQGLGIKCGLLWQQRPAVEYSSVLT